MGVGVGVGRHERAGLWAGRISWGVRRQVAAALPLLGEVRKDVRPEGRAAPMLLL